MTIRELSFWPKYYVNSFTVQKTANLMYSGALHISEMMMRQMMSGNK